MGQPLGCRRLVSVFGQRFAPVGALRALAGADVVDGRLPDRLDGVCVEFGGVCAPLFLLTPGQINAQVPAVTGASVAVQIVTNCGAATEARSNAFWPCSGECTTRSASPAPGSPGGSWA